MGCVNGSPLLDEKDLEFIATYTAVTRDEVDRQYENFLTKHPDGKITKRDFRQIMQVICNENSGGEGEDLTRFHHGDRTRDLRICNHLEHYSIAVFKKG